MRVKTIMKLGIIMTGGLALSVLASACVSVPEDLDTEQCINDCEADARECLGVKVPCPEASECFDDMEICFDDTTACSQFCTGCEGEGTCPEGEDACADLCSTKGNQCVKMVRECADLKEACFNKESSVLKGCMSQVVKCSAGCVGEAEDAIKNLMYEEHELDSIKSPAEWDCMAWPSKHE